MSGRTLGPGEDWSALRRRFAGEALARVLALCGHAVQCRRREGTGDGLFLTEGGRTVPLRVGPAALLWRGKPLDGVAPDWPRDVSADAARFFLTARPLAATAALDMDLAARRDDSNPYYFVLCIQKRMRSLLSRRGPEERVAAAPLSEVGRALAVAVGRFPAEVRRAAGNRDPYPVNRYALELAGAARQFLRAGEENPSLLAAAEMTLRNVLSLLGARP